MSFTLDAFFKQKRLVEKQEQMIKFPDKRRFKTRMTRQESIEKTIISEISAYGVENPQRMFNILKKIKHYQTLSITLLLISYFYYSDKNFNFGLVVQDFDKDFEMIVDQIYEKGYFSRSKNKKFSPGEIFRLRQDFIVYMLLIENSEDTQIDENQTVELLDTGEEINGFYDTTEQPIGD
jgi:hypothetical protein